MKKLSIILFLLVAFVVNIFAQKKLEIYTAANLGLSKVKFTPSIGEISSNISGGIGLHIIYPIRPNIGLIVMPVLQQRGYTSLNSANNFDVRVTYIDIPVSVELGFGARALIGFSKFAEGEEKPFFFSAGIYEGIAIGGKYTDKFYNNPSVKIKFGESTTDQRSRTDFGVNFTLGLRFKSRLGKFKFGLQNQRGLKNCIPNDRKTKDGSLKTGNFGFFVAYGISNLFNKKLR